MSRAARKMNRRRNRRLRKLTDFVMKKFGFSEEQAKNFIKATTINQGKAP